MGLNYCCCCAPLRTGALVVAILYLFVNCGMVLSWSILTVYVAAVHDHRPSHVYFGVILAGLIGVCGINITVDSLLVHGIRRNHRKFMLPWVVWYGIFKSATAIAWLVGIAFLSAEIAMHPRNREGVVILHAFLCIMVPVGVVLFSVMWYWYACVVSYYIQLAPSDHYVMEPLRQPKTADDPALSPDETSDATAGLVTP